ncbi:MAG TPA: choice-of-anchor B family protein [Saprospiraceae bacterium]|nr:choice-of-anchor B family protein [Saprospiraceae bacterium]
MRISFVVGLVIAFFASLFNHVAGQSNLNMTLHDSLNYNVGVNDVTGWADSLGNEYAIVGLNTGVSIVDVESNPIKEVAFVTGTNNTWRDINTFGHYAYVVSEAHIGLLIIDLQFLPDSVQTFVWKPGGDVPFEKAHTIWIDEYGIGYLNGSNLNSGGVVMVDLVTNPIEPKLLGYGPPIYSHDSYARDSILYSAEIYNGDASIYDVHDPLNVVLLGRVKTPNEFTHNVWPSDDTKYMFTTDERPDSYVTAYDIQDRGNIKEVDRFRQAATDGSGNIPHNVYVWNDWLVIAYYTSGTLIVDAARPNNLIEVGSFDSFLGADGDYNGVWGSYPFLPSGKILSSDRQSGLFVFVPNYVRAAYLEGLVLDSITQVPIQGAVVKIISDEIILPQITGIDGKFRTGKAIPGTYDVIVTKPGYYTKTLHATFINGELLTPLFELNPLPIYNFSGKIIDSEGEELPFAKVVMMGVNGIYNSQSNATGDFVIPAFEGTYEVQAGVWGETIETEISLDNPLDVILQTVRGYHDDFDLDLGWVVTGDATQGQWERGIPTRQLLFNFRECGSATDSPFDKGSFVYTTGLSSSMDVTNSSVTDGFTLLTSPGMNLDSISIAHLSFDYWICEFPPNQYGGAITYLTNGVDTLLLMEMNNDSLIPGWHSFFVDIDVSEWDGPRDNFKILVNAMDTTSGSEEFHLKVHFDNFKLDDSAVGIADENKGTYDFKFYPNPIVDNQFFLSSQSELTEEHLLIKICDVQGRIVTKYDVTKWEAESGLTHQLENGIYFIQWQSDKGETGVEKILVLRK